MVDVRETVGKGRGVFAQYDGAYHQTAPCRLSFIGPLLQSNDKRSRSGEVVKCSGGMVMDCMNASMCFHGVPEKGYGIAALINRVDSGLYEVESFVRGTDLFLFGRGSVSRNAVLCWLFCRAVLRPARPFPSGSGHETRIPLPASDCSVEGGR